MPVSVVVPAPVLVSAPVPLMSLLTCQRIAPIDRQRAVVDDVAGAQRAGGPAVADLNVPALIVVVPL